MYERINLNETPSLKKLVYDYLLREIVSGRLQPNTRLLEAEIASALNVSRAPIREALNMLERDGFTKIIPHKGSIVAEVTKQDICEIWEIRRILEPYAAKASCRLIPKDVLLSLSAQLKELLSDPEDFDKYIETDTAVHSILYKYYNNEYLQTILDKLKSHSIRTRWTAERQNKNPKMCLLSIREHLAIVDALLSGDADAVYNAVFNHIKESELRLLNELSASQADS